MEVDEDYKNRMMEEGVTVVEDIDKAAWREAAQPVYDEYADEIGVDLLNQIQEMISK